MSSAEVLNVTLAGTSIGLWASRAPPTTLDVSWLAYIQTIVPELGRFDLARDGWNVLDHEHHHRHHNWSIACDPTLRIRSFAPDFTAHCHNNKLILGVVCDARPQLAGALRWSLLLEKVILSRDSLAILIHSSPRLAHLQNVALLCVVSLKSAYITLLVYIAPCSRYAPPLVSPAGSHGHQL